ncbi:hypothetical protein U27_00269 [Candidatus Vecturithrix granuli]|uniref:Uncharacterized protein n=1 Tax=Vecturithrix granuli TaxID=1499967 RepID=A0A081C723_VECG1|nr:hypothetical protein U27_00269 [Candidatus Vecturithrix granuli]
MTNTSQQHTMTIEDVQRVLEPLLRRIIREEVMRLSQEFPQTFYLTPDMPLYEDMEDIAQRRAVNDIVLYSHDEVWNEPISAKV